MTQSIPTTVLRWIFLAFNVIFWLGGCAFIFVGVKSMLSAEEFADEEFNLDKISMSSYVLIGVGILVALIGFVGCSGAWGNIAWLLKLYAGFILVLFVIEMGALIFTWFYRAKVNDYIKVGLDTSMKSYNKDKNTTDTLFWDKTQQNLECCGSDSPSSWETYANFSSGDFPWSCCKDNAFGDDCNLKNAFKDGCLPKVSDTVESQLLVVVLVLIIFGLVQWFGIIISYCLATSIPNEYNEV